MAERWAVSAGVWSDPATWNGGTLPDVTDDVYSNGFIVTIDVDVTVLSLNSRSGTIPVAGGKFISNLTRTVNADVYGGTTDCLELNNNSVLNGNSYGSMTTDTMCGVYLQNSTHNGNSYGGNGLTRSGSYLDSSTHNGNSYGGTGNEAFGSLLSYNSIQVGDCYGGSGTSSYGSYVYYSTHSGDAYGSDAVDAYGIYLRYSSFCGNVTSGTSTNAHGIFVIENSYAFIESSTGNTAGAFGVYSADRNVIIIKNEVGLYAKSIGTLNVTDPNLFPFLSFERILASDAYSPFGPRVFRGK